MESIYNAEHPYSQSAIKIIEHVIEPLMLQLQREDIDPEDGLTGELYHETEMVIVRIINENVMIGNKKM